MYEATAFTQSGKPKNPIAKISAADKILQTDDAGVTKFYFGIHRFQDKSTGEQSVAALEELKAILKNPLKLNFYQHKPEISENIVASSIAAFAVGAPARGLELSVLKKGSFFEVTAVVDLVHTKIPLSMAAIRYDYFLEADGVYHPAANLRLLKLVKFFNEHGNSLLIHQNKFEEFRANFLAKLEQDTEIQYLYLPPATPEQIAENKLDKPAERFIYLKDSDPYVELDLVMKYGDSEISILSKQQIYPKGIPRTFYTSRDNKAEAGFAALIIKQHPQFREQADDALPYFYLHKKHFLDEAWFLKTFEEWRSQGIQIHITKAKVRKYLRNLIGGDRA